MRDREMREAAEADGLGTLIDIIGVDNAMLLHKSYAGSKVHIPETPADDHDLTVLLGREQCDRLAFYFGGTALSLPLGKHMRTVRRRREIESLRRKGKTAAEIARIMGMSERGVRGLMATARKGKPKPRTRHLCGFSAWQIKFLARRFDKSEKIIRAAIAPETLHARPYAPEQGTFPFATNSENTSHPTT